MNGAFSRGVRRAALLALALLPAAPLAAQTAAGGVYLIRGGTVVPRAGEALEGASVLIRDGRIAAVGREVAAPEGAVVIEARGRWVYPGMIDSDTRLGLQEIGAIAATVDVQEIGDVNPQLRALTAVNPHSELIPVTRTNGVTTALTRPAGGTISGQAALIHLDGWTPEEMAVRPSAALVVQYPRAPGGFGGARTPEQERTARERVERQVRELREFLEQAREYHRGRGAGAAASDLTLEAMRPVLDREVPVLMLADTREQIEGALRLADDFGLRLMLGGGDEAWKVAPELARRQVPVVLGPVLSTPGSDAPYDALFAQPGMLHRAGVRFAFSTGEAANSRHLPYHAAMAVAYGLPADAALRALTLAPAEIWGVADRLGTLEPGKSADLFIATGDPLDVRTRVEEVFIAGKRVPMEDRHSRLYERFRGRPRS